MRKQHVVLEDETHGPALGGIIHALPGDPLPIEQNLPRLQALESGGEPE